MFGLDSFVFGGALGLLGFWAFFLFFLPGVGGAGGWVLVFLVFSNMPVLEGCCDFAAKALRSPIVVVTYLPGTAGSAAKHPQTKSLYWLGFRV